MMHKLSFIVLFLPSSFVHLRRNRIRIQILHDLGDEFQLFFIICINPIALDLSHNQMNVLCSCVVRGEMKEGEDAACMKPSIYLFLISAWGSPPSLATFYIKAVNFRI